MGADPRKPAIARPQRRADWDGLELKAAVQMTGFWVCKLQQPANQLTPDQQSVYRPRTSVTDTFEMGGAISLRRQGIQYVVLHL